MKERKMDEVAYGQGSRSAWRIMLSECLRQLGYKSSDAEKTKWIIEREEAIAALRRICAAHGDNDWPETLNLADILDKHLDRHLD
jgi:hypothetical protein